VPKDDQSALSEWMLGTHNKAHKNQTGIELVLCHGITNSQ